MQSCLKHGYGRAGLAASETFLINSGNLYRIITLPFSQTDNSVVVYRTSTSACHAWNMAASGLDSPPQANFVFVHWFLSWPYMIINWLLRRSVRLSILLDLCVWFRCASVLYAPQSLSARSRSDSPPSLLALFLFASRCFTGHRSVHVVLLCAYRPSTSAFRLHHVIGLPSSPIILVGFLVTPIVSFDMLLIIVVL